jgi:hypothetical protein
LFSLLMKNEYESHHPPSVQCHSSKVKQYLGETLEVAYSTRPIDSNCRLFRIVLLPKFYRLVAIYC